MNAPVYPREASRPPVEEPADSPWGVLAWSLTPFVLALGMLLLSGCARPLDTAIVAANSARDVGMVSADVIATQCTARYRTAAPEDVPAINEVCGPAAQAYDAYRSAWAALVAAIQVAQLRDVPSTPELLALMVRLGTVAEGLSRAIGGVR